MKRYHVLIMIVLGALFLAACNQDNEEDEKVERIIPIEIGEAKIGAIADEQIVYGRTAPIKTTPITIETPGEVESIEVKSGDVVKKDDLLAKIKTLVGNVHIKAPADGELAQFTLKKNGFVSNEEPLGMILNTDEMEITVEVTSKVRGLFKRDNEHDVSIGEDSYKATVETIDSLPNDKGLYEVLLTVENEDNNILAGDIAGVKVKATVIKDALLLPTESVIEESDGAFVYVIVDGKAKKVDLEVIEMRSDVAAVKGEIEEGDEVAVNGQLTLEDGSKVDVKVVNES